MSDTPDEFQPPTMDWLQRFTLLLAMATTSYAVVRLFEMVFTS